MQRGLDRGATPSEKGLVDNKTVTKYELEILIERLEGFRRFIPLNDGEEPCNGDLLESLIKMVNTKCSGNNVQV